MFCGWLVKPLVTLSKPMSSNNTEKLSKEHVTDENLKALLVWIYMYKFQAKKVCLGQAI